ncbi:MAG: excinuclease ABC subunit A [Chloroflexi bacterium]|nr:excinuclease ABC subunit A [Chloroflexota bacterium]|tara:strand:+ start:2314 stop:5247 length:2934 start_codon:yes stop_codon:yes gene_type:complete
MALEKIVVVGAREHNLKNVDVDIPRDKLVVITGLSGSGKSSLAFDTIFAEGQRRYVESLSAYARQFLGQLDKPDVDYIEGLSPAVSIDQKGVSKNPRSTVGTVTEIYDYLRLLFARVGVPHCPQCQRRVSKQNADGIVQSVRKLPAGSRIMLIAPLVKDRKGEHKRLLADVRKSGFLRVIIDGEIHDVNEIVGNQDENDSDFVLDRHKNHNIYVVVDRLILPKTKEEDKQTLDEFLTRLTDSVETALRVGGGSLAVQFVEPGVQKILLDESLLFSEHFACAHCGISLPELEPRSFSFNSPHGACSDCQGLGHRLEVDENLVIPDKSLSIDNSAIDAMEWRSGPHRYKDNYVWQALKGTCEYYNIPTDKPISELTRNQLDILLYGNGNEDMLIPYVDRNGNNAVWKKNFEGVVGNLKRRYRETNSDYMRRKIESYMTQHDCNSCGGKRLRAEVLAVTIDGKNIVDITNWPVTSVMDWSNQLLSSGLNKRQIAIGRQILKEINTRLKFMIDVGLNYLTLARSTASLSGGEAQRIRLATQIGSQLTGVLYVLDEPSVGLHQRDNARLISTLKSMRDLGNTVLVVEHDEETIREADWVVDLGPGAGSNGGEVVAQGTTKDIIDSKRSLTGAYLSGRRCIEVPKLRREGNGDGLIVRGAREHNLKNIDVTIPLGKVVCITGVSGSGKSTLVNDILYRSVAKDLHGARTTPGDHDEIEGVGLIDKIINIDQSPIGRTPRSNAATYTGLFDHIRKLFAELPDSKIRGYKPGRYSFNVKGGRCEGCQGQGQLRIEMQFLADIYVPCEECNGARYNRETLQVRFKGLTIADVLAMSVDESTGIFNGFASMMRKLSTLQSVGLGYIKIGQSATTLSGGEAQRVKLSKELSRRYTGRTLYVLDEPSVGLHAADVERLIGVLGNFADKGNTVVVIEHHPDIIKVADHIIDLGPEGGVDGGHVIADGTPEEIASVANSYTGQFLRELLVS